MPKRMSTPDGTSEDREPPVPNAEDLHDVIAESLAFPVADDIPDAGAEDAAGESKEQAGFENAMLAIFLIELVVAHPIADESAEHDDDAIPANAETAIDRGITEIGSGQPVPAGVVDGKPANQGIRQSRANPFAHQEESENGKGDRPIKAQLDRFHLLFRQIGKVKAKVEGAPEAAEEQHEQRRPDEAHGRGARGQFKRGERVDGKLEEEAGGGIGNRAAEEPIALLLREFIRAFFLAVFANVLNDPIDPEGQKQDA